MCVECAKCACLCEGSHAKMNVKTSPVIDSKDFHLTFWFVSVLTMTVKDKIT